MRPDTLEIVCCPACFGDLRAIGGEALFCGSCTRRYPIVHGVPQLFADQAPARAEFDDQWELHRRGLIESADQLYAMRPEVFVEKVVAPRLGEVRAGDLIADAGCGTSARAAAIARRYPQARVVAFDLAEAVFRGENGPSNLHLIRADIRTPPLRRASVNKLLSWGVIHHVAEPRAAFDTLAATLAPGGRCLIWLYPPGDEAPSWRPFYFVRDVVFANRGHQLSPRARLWASRALCAAAILPIWARSFSAASTTALYPELRQLNLRQIYDGAVMVTFDTLTPEFQHRLTKNEVQRWFEAAGFSEVRTDGQGAYEATKLSS